MNIVMSLVTLVRMVAASVVLLGMALTATLVSFIPKVSRKAAGSVVRIGCQLLMATLGISRSRRGPAPGASTLIVANHLSWTDIPVLLASWRCAFVAKREVRSWPIVGTLAEAIGVIFIDRSRPRDLLRVIPLIESTLRGGTSVVLFPEGTTTSGRTVSRFRSGLLQAAIRAQVAVTPLALSATAAGGETDALCWTGDETLVANLYRVASLRATRVTVHVAGPISDLGNRKALAMRAHFEVEKRFRPIPRERINQERAATSDGLSSVLAKQNFLPMESSDREILA